MEANYSSLVKTSLAATVGIAGLACWRYFNTKSQQSTNPEDSPSSLSGIYPLYRICFTGGPCGGKTSALNAVKAHFTAKGYRVFSVLETATLTSEGGWVVNPAEMTSDVILDFESKLVNLQVYLEDYFIGLARLTNKPAIVLCDRGVMDPCAYVSEERLSKILDNQAGWNLPELRDKRYDAIMFFVTAADGAAGFYTTANNQARSEDAARALELDQATLNVWAGHNNLEVLHNPAGQTFQHKINRCIDAIEHLVGEAHSVWTRKAFLTKCQTLKNFPADIHKTTLDITETYLQGVQGVESKLVRRGQQGNYTYALRISTKLFDGKNTKNERLALKKDQYERYLATKKHRCQLNFKRTIFFYKKQRFEFDQHRSANNLVEILHYVQRGQAAQRELPPFVEIVQDITDHPNYTPQNMTRIHLKQNTKLQ